MNICAIAAFLALMSPVSSERFMAASPQDIILLTEDFEGDMSQWIGQSGGAHSGVIVPDPLNPGNHVVTFSALADLGDVFSFELPIYHAFVYIVWFDYLGLPKEGTPEGNTGGRFGIADDAPGGFSFWMAATVDEPCTDELIDDGQWHRYHTFFFPECIPGLTNFSFRIMLEDWCGRPPDAPQGVSGDAFFDNIQLIIHEVSVESTSWGAVKALYR